jgi:hypothetical protein
MVVYIAYNTISIYIIGYTECVIGILVQDNIYHYPMFLRMHSTVTRKRNILL